MRDATLLDPYTTTRKVFAEGVRSVEMPIPQPGPPTQMRETAPVHHDSYTIGLPMTRRQRRKMFRRLPFGSVPGYAPICCDSNDPDTIKASIFQRLVRDLPVPEPGMLDRFGVFVKKFCAENLPVVTVPTFEEWLEATSYNEQRKQQLRKCHVELRGGRPTLKQAKKISSFIKTESYPIWKQARSINSRSDFFKVWSGPMFKAIENAVYALPEFIKHTPVPDRPEKVRGLRKANRHYYQTDFTAFESHFTMDFLTQCELVLYRHCLGPGANTDFLCNVIGGNLGHNMLHYRAGVRAAIPSRRMSGDMCTSLGNGFTNLMLAKFLASEQGKELEGFVEGDDGLFSTEAILTPELYARLGFSIKIEEVEDPCRGSFCGMIFPESGEIIRDPRRFLENFGWTSSFIHAGLPIMQQLLRAKALSACYEAPQCPVVGVLARRALVHTTGAAPRFVDDGYHYCPRDVLNVPAFNPSPDTRVLFAQEFGVSVEVQLAVEAAINADDMVLVSTLLPASIPMQEYANRYVAVT